MNKLLEVENLHVHIRKGRRSLVAVEDVSFALEAGHTLGVMGESGCGKSITFLALTRLAAPNIRIAQGEALLEGKSLTALPDREFDALRGKAFSMIFQDSISGLNPLLKVGRQVAETLEIHTRLGREEIRRQVLELLVHVRLEDPEIAADKYPHQLSGGQRQRVMIAMAIASGPKLLIADEPTTALDVTTQLQILGLLQDLQKETGMGMILISHDVAVIRQMCQEVLVMYSGQVMESGLADRVLCHPRHPYTAALIRSVAGVGQKGHPLHTIRGTVAPLEQRQTVEGCVFADRCEVRCQWHREPVPLQTLEDGRQIRCHRKGGVEHL